MGDDTANTAIVKDNNKRHRGLYNICLNTQQNKQGPRCKNGNTDWSPAKHAFN